MPNRSKKKQKTHQHVIFKLFDYEIHSIKTRDELIKELEKLNDRSNRVNHKPT